ncbi:EpsG family protein [Vibrio campbellii]|uniref:EpsG family protein n=1 Tax=Vibrio campbellii TaxID=680 RepID=UPI003CE5A743
MISAYLYIFNVLVFFVSYFSKNTNLKIYFLVSSFSSMLLMLMLRDSSLGTDYVGYLRIYNYISTLKLEQLVEMRYELVFKYFIKFLSEMFSAEVGIFLLCVIFNILMLLSIYFMRRDINFIICCQFTLTSFFLYYDLQYNIIRQGLSLALFLMASSFLFRGKIKISLLFFFLSWGFHQSAILYIAILLIVFFLDKLRLVNKLLPTIFFVTIINVILSFFGVFEIFSRELLAVISSDSYYSAYTSDNFEYQNGFRLDFIFLTLVPLVVSFYYRLRMQSRFVLLMAFNIICFNVYIFLNWIAYADRLLVFPWILNAILISYVITLDFTDKKIKLLVVIFLIASGVYSNFTNPNVILNLNII